MKRLEKLKKLNTYLRHFHIPGHSEIQPIHIVDQGDATSRLARTLGDQVLIAIPESYQNGGTDQFSEQISLAFFILTRVNNQVRQQDIEDDAYSRLLDIAEVILDCLCEDMSEHHCQFLGGLEMSGVSVVPEYSLFGGWSGYSIEIVF